MSRIYVIFDGDTMGQGVSSICRSIRKVCHYGKAMAVLAAVSACNPAYSNPQINSVLESGITDIVQTAQHPGMQMKGANIWLEDAELRLSTDNADNRKDAYQLRLEPKTPRQVRSEKKLLDLHARQSDTNYRLLLNDVLRDRYLILIELMKNKRNLESLQRRHQHVKDEISLYRQLAHGEDFQPVKLQKAIVEEKQLNLLIRNKSLQLQKALSPYGISSDSLIWNQWVQPDEIMSLAGRYKGEEVSDNPAMKKSLLKLQAVRESMQRDRARKSFGAKLLLLEYEKEKDETTTVGIGLRIPLGGESFDAVNSQFDIAEIQEEVRQNRLALESSLRDRHLNMETLQQELIMQNMLLKDIRDQLKKVGHLPIADLMLNMRQQEDQVQNQMETLQLQLVEEYIQFMHENVLLSSEPLRNWILTDQPVL